MERSNEVRTEPQGADAGDQAILEGADSAGPGNHEMWSDRPRQVPRIPPYWPIPLLPSSAINSELQNVVNVAGPVQERFARHQSYVGVAQSREIIALSALGAHRKSCLKRHRVKEDSLRACLESSPQPNEAKFILLPFCLSVRSLRPAISNPLTSSLWPATFYSNAFAGSCAAMMWSFIIIAANGS